METPPTKENDGSPSKHKQSQKTPPIPTPSNPRRQSSGHHFAADTQPLTQITPQAGHSRSQVTVVSRASAKAEHDLSNLSCIYVYVVLFKTPRKWHIH